MTPRQRAMLTADDLEWEDPPHAGRAMTEDTAALIEVIKSMVPALRERPEKWAVVETFDGAKTASNRGTTLKRVFGTLDTIEARLQFRGALILESDPPQSKLYVRLRSTK